MDKRNGRGETEEQERVAQIKENRQDISSETSESRTAEPGKRKGFWKNLTEPVERTFSEEPFPEEGVVSEVDTHKETHTHTRSDKTL